MRERHYIQTIHANDSLFHGMQAVEQAGHEVALVVSEDKLVGLLTGGDCRRALLHGMGFDAPVQRAMQTEFTWVPPSMGRAEVLDLMKARRFKQVPVLSSDGKLLGLHLLDDLLGTTERKNAALILCGGLGTRLRPITESIPKPMIPVAGRPILERLVLHLVGFGFRDLYLAVHYLGNMIEDHFGDGSRFGCRIHYIREEKPLGTGGAIGLLPDHVNAPFLVINGDLVTQFDAGQLLDCHQASGNRITIGASSYVHEVPFGVLATDNQRVLSIQEKPKLSFSISAGIYVIEPSIRDRIQPPEFTPITAIIEQCLAAGEPVGYFPIDQEWVDVGRHDELKRARGEA
jgi:dTDP-glucose pyrophosphorylase